MNRRLNDGYILYLHNNIFLWFWKRTAICLFKGTKATQENGVGEMKEKAMVIIMMIASAISILALVEFHIIGFVMLISLAVSIRVYVAFDEEIIMTGHAIEDIRENSTYQ
ncbi:hypothetical protein D3C74_216190 [compost metagenome]